MTFAQVLELAGFVLALLGIIWNFAYGKGKDDELERNLNFKIDRHILDNEKTDASIFAQLTRMWEWKDAHEKDAANMRLELQKQIGKIEAGLQLHDGQYAGILQMIAAMGKTIEAKIDKLEEKIEKLNK